MNDLVARRVFSPSGDNRNIGDFNRILLNNKDQQVVIVNCAPRSKSAIHDCIVGIFFYFVYIFCFI